MAVLFFIVGAVNIFLGVIAENELTTYYHLITSQTSAIMGMLIIVMERLK